jgi:hypothetical protein
MFRVKQATNPLSWRSNYRCFLDWQITGSTRSHVSNSEVVMQMKSTHIYPGLGPSMEVIVQQFDIDGKRCYKG